MRAWRSFIKKRKLKNATIKYIAYCRRSTDEKNKQVLSIEAQIVGLKEFASKIEQSLIKK